MAIVPEFSVQPPAAQPVPELEPEPVVSVVPGKLNGSLAITDARLELVKPNKVTAVNSATARNEGGRNNLRIFMV